MANFSVGLVFGMLLLGTSSRSSSRSPARDLQHDQLFVAAQPTVVATRSAVGSTRPTVVAVQAAVGTTRPTVGTVQAAFVAVQAAFVAARPTVVAVQAAVCGSTTSSNCAGATTSKCGSTMLVSR